MDKPPPPLLWGASAPAPPAPPAAHRPGAPRHAVQPAGRGRGAIPIYGGRTENQWKPGGTPHGHAHWDRAGVPPQAWLPRRTPHGQAPGAAPARHGGMKRERGWGRASTVLPLGKDPQVAITLRGSPGQLRQERGRAELRAGAGMEEFLPPPHHGVAGVPPWPRSAGHLLWLPPGPARGAANIKPAALPPLSSPRPPRATPRGGATCAPLGQTATEPKTQRKRKGNGGIKPTLP